LGLYIGLTSFFNSYFYIGFYKFCDKFFIISTIGDCGYYGLIPKHCGEEGNTCSGENIIVPYKLGVVLLSNCGPGVITSGVFSIS